MDWCDVQELSRCGMEIGSHSHTHPENLCRLSDEKIREELKISKEILEDKIDKTVTSVSAPHGYWNHRVFQLSRELNYQRFFTSEPGYHSHVPHGCPVQRFSAHRRVSLKEIDRILGGSIPLLVRLKIRYFLLGWLKKAISDKTFRAIRGKLC
jgi:peptidoglycan/xylan/chitin deacetylase (PgdA/CDA1 family)